MNVQHRFAQSSSEAPEIHKTASDYKKHFPRADEAAIEAGMRVSRTHFAETAALIRYFAALGFDISVPRHSVLRILRFADGAPKTLNDLRAELSVTSGAVTSLVDGLEEDGLVTRIPHPVDRRATIVELTESGRGVADLILAAIPGFFEALFEDFSPDEKRTLNALLSRLQEKAQSSYME